MNAIVWVILANTIMMCVNLWVLYNAIYLADLLEELHTKNWGRFSELINQLTELKEK